MLSAEPYPPYAPPAMADHFLTGRDHTLYWKGRDVCARLGVQFRANCRIERLDSGARELLLADGGCLAYDRLVIATGSGLYAPVEGRELPGVYNFKSLSAAEALIGGVRAGRIRQAVVVGAGFIGVEIALLLQDLGVQVTLVEALDRVIPAILEPETADIALDAIRDRGVDVRLQTRAEAFTGEAGPPACGWSPARNCAPTPASPPPASSPTSSGWPARASRRNGAWSSTTACAPACPASTPPATWPRRATASVASATCTPSSPTPSRRRASSPATCSADEIEYAGAESMNSLKHLGVEVIAAGDHGAPDQLAWRRDGKLRKLFLREGRIVGYSLVGDIRGAGVYRSLMLKGRDVTPLRDRLLDPRPGAAWLSAAVA
jgi:nitrite reductase (NADH) large subunit